MNIFKDLRNNIIDSLELLVKAGKLPENLDYTNITAEPPKDASHGDIATNAAMVLAKPAKMNPRELAAIIIEQLKTLPVIKAAEIAGPGFINLKLAPSAFHKIVEHVLKDGTSYGNSEAGKGIKVNLEYVSANPTGPMHVGHSRNAIYGDVLSYLLIKTGHSVTKEYYINDAGAQVEVLAKSAMLRYREALGENIGAIPEGLYPGDYLVPVGYGLKEKYDRELLEMNEPEALKIIKAFAIDSMLALIKADLLSLGVVHDVFTSEQKIKDSGKIEEAFNTLNQKGFIYTGTLPPPKGKPQEDWEPADLTLFRTTDFGDDSDRPLKKRNGEWAYVMPDIAYSYDKLQRGFNQIILVVATDHAGYVKRIKASVSALSDNKAEMHVQLYQMVNLLENGQPIKMSKRAGKFLTLRDVIDEVGKDILRFTMLTKKHDTILDFDLVKVKEQSKDNPVFYVQYAHARIHSVLRNAAAAGIVLDLDKIPALETLTHSAELSLIRKISEWPRIVESAALSLEPHRIVYYLQELAAEFHGLWNLGKDDTSLKFIVSENNALTLARLALVKACSITIASGLSVLGVEPVMEM